MATPPRWLMKIYGHIHQAINIYDLRGLLKNIQRILEIIKMLFMTTSFVNLSKNKVISSLYIVRRKKNININESNNKRISFTLIINTYFLVD